MNFNEKCYNVVKRVPKGKVISYKQIAEELGCKAYRAVGNAMNKNCNKDVPCHRVVKSDGGVGGFARGQREKIRLLKKEGVKIENNKIDFKKYGFF